jgi:quercetin dioxygenase-like cupin family protein
VPENFLGRVLQAFELGELVARLSRTPEVRTLAEGLCPPETERSWQMLYHDEGVDVWLIVWRRQADTGWHDHDTSAGAFHVIEGEVSEARPNLFGGGTPRTVTIGDSVHFGFEHVHRLTGVADRSVTVHAYSPPLSRMGRYLVEPDGTLLRVSVRYDAEVG